MSGYSGLDFPSIGAELGYWLTHVSQAYKGGYPGSGENGYDFSMPEGTPVYAILPGKVVGVGSYGGGGVVSVQYNAQNIVYYQHLRANQVKVGDNVGAGQQIGLSGGLHNTDGSPVSCCSSYPHIEVGLNAPFGGMWNPNNVTPNANPIGLFNALNSQYQANNVAVGGAGVSALGYTGGLIGIPGPGITGNQQSRTCDHPIVIAGQQVGCVPDTVYNWITQPIRIFKMLAGVLLLTFAALLFIVPPVIGPATEVAGVATGQPEVVAAGAAISSIRGRKPVAGVSVQTPARPREVKLKARAAPVTQPTEETPEPPPFTTGPEQPPPTGPTSPRRAPTTKPLAGGGLPGTAGFEQQQQSAQAASNVDDLQRRSDEAYQKSQDRSLSATERKFWRNTAVDLERQIKKLGGTSTRGAAAKATKQNAAPKTSVLDTFFFGARRLVSRKPIPDREVIQTKQMMHEWYANPEQLRKFMDFQQGQKTAEEQRQKRANMTPEETRRALGLSGTAGAEKVPGTETTLEAEQTTLRGLQALLKVTTDPKVRAAIERDIASTQARIAKKQKG